MKVGRMLTTVDAHTEGMALRLVTGGIPRIPGKTMAEKRDFVKDHLDYLRTALCQEPRGHDAMFACLLTSPVSEEASFGAIYMWSPRSTKLYPNMCGHGSIAVATIAVATGMVEATEPVTKVVFDTPAGTIQAKVNVENGKIQSTSIQLVPCFFYQTAPVNVPGIGRLPVDIVFAGNCFGIVEAADLGLRLRMDEIARAEGLLTKVKESINEQVAIKHPELDSLNRVESLLLNDKPNHQKANVLNVSYNDVRSIDRSPCGTGTSAKMASLYGKGKLKLGEVYVTESLIGSLFYGKLIREVAIGSFKAVVPEITGSAFITGMHSFVMDEDDPFKHGFKL